MAYDWTGAMTSMAAGNPAGWQAGFLSNKPETDYWENYQRMMQQLLPAYNRQARFGIGEASRAMGAKMAGAGLNTTTLGPVRQGMMQSQLGPALAQAEQGASQQAGQLASQGSYMLPSEQSEYMKNSMNIMKLLGFMSGGGLGGAGLGGAR